jgi:internalin A
MIDQELLEIIDKASTKKSLSLKKRNLTQFPIEITQLSHLEKLVISENNLSELPSEFTKISELKYLDISGNQLSQLPLEIIKLSKIDWLSLKNNKLSELSPEIGQLSHLRHLVLSDNKLSQLPREIANLSELTHLSLDNNQLSEIPLEIAQLSQLTRLDLRGNPLPIPPEILNKVTEPATILNYYKELQKAKSKRSLNEIKMLVVGQGGVGKTSLIKRLMDESLNPDENKTEGINVRKCFFSLNNKNNEKIQVNIWDFGGQEIMHATHQFFLTERSIYLLVLKGTSKKRIEYPLNSKKRSQCVI